MPSCETCPSRLSPEEAAYAFGKDPGVPVCARFGHFLSKPNVSQSRLIKITEHYAGTCDQYGDPRPISMPSYTDVGIVAAPNALDMMERSNTGDVDSPASCGACKFYVPADVVREEMGWELGMCRARGQLIFPNKMREMAQDCFLGIIGDSPDTTSGIIELPIYNDQFTTGDVVKKFVELNNQPVIEPTEYETDRDVQPEELALGIRAWRRITSQEDDTKHVFVPVFRVDYFDAREQVKIPRTGDDEHPEWYFDHDDFVYTTAALWMDMDKTPILHGQAGVGKTELARHLAWIMCLPFDRMSVTRASEVDDFIGKMVFQDGETAWKMGRLPIRWAKPGVVLLDEPNVGPDELWQLIRPLTDNSKQMVLDQNEGERITRHPFAFMMMAMNPDWDVKYVGTNPLSAADISRAVHVFVGLPPEEVERLIILRWCQEIEGYEPGAETLDKVMAIAGEIRSLVSQGSIPISWNIREQVKVMQLLHSFPMVRAYRLAITNALEPQTGEQILTVVKAWA